MTRQVPGSGTSQVREAVNEQARGLFAGAILRTNLKVRASSSLYVVHGLGRVPKGYVILRKSAPSDIHEDLSSTQRHNSIAIVNPEAFDVTFDLAVLP